MGNCVSSDPPAAIGRRHDLHRRRSVTISSLPEEGEYAQSEKKVRSMLQASRASSQGEGFPRQPALPACLPAVPAGDA